MSNRVLLDIDDTLITRSLLLTGNEGQHETNGKSKQFDSAHSFVILPKPGACIKTKTDCGEKVFLNVCTSDKIPPAEDISETKLFELLLEEQPSFVVPMSIGGERLESDKGGLPCLTYDVAINTMFYEKCQNSKSFWLFVISIIMEGVSNKFGKILDIDNYVILRNRKVMGKLQQHRIENREPRKQLQTEKPLIEEIPSVPKGVETERKGLNFTTRNEIPLQSSDVAVRSYVILKQPMNGTPARLIGLFQVSEGITSKDVEILINPDRVVVAVDKTGITYDITVPYFVKPSTAKCYLDKVISVVRLDVLVDNTHGDVPN